MKLALFAWSMTLLAMDDPAWLPKYPNAEAGISKSSSVEEIISYLKDALAHSTVKFQALSDGVGVAIRASDDKMDCLIRVHETADGPAFVESGCTQRGPRIDANLIAAARVRAPHYGVTMSDFGRIGIGMSYGDVVTILGTGTVLSHSELAGHVTTMYGWNNLDGSNMNVMIQDGKVVIKAQAGLR